MTRTGPTKLQRWLDLIAFLVGRRLPVAVEELMEAVPAYADKWRTEDDTARATARRTFERDKEELRQAGIPIRTVRYSMHFGREEVEGYRIDRRDFYLPYLRLVATPHGRKRAGYDERTRVADVEIAPEHLRLAVDAAWRVAELPAFPLERDARAAVRKLTFDLAGPPPGDAPPVLFVESGDVLALRERLRLLADALLLRKRVGFRYHGLYRNESTERDVAPFGLLFQQGQWYLVGHDAMRDDVRTFRVGRMDDVQPNAREPATADYAIPPGFRLGDYVGRRPWELGDAAEPVLSAHVRFRFPLSLWAERNGHGTLVDSRDDGSTVRAFEVRQVEPFARWVLGCGPEAEILSPAALADALRAMAARVVAAHDADIAAGEPDV